MGHGPGRDEEGHHQHQGIQIVTEHAHEAHPPDAGEDHAQQRQQDAVEAAGVDDQNGQHDQDGVKKDEQDVAAVGIHPAHQHRVAGGVDFHPGGGLLGPDGLQFLEHLAVIQLALVEGALDQGRLQVRRHQQAIDIGAGDHIPLDPGQLLLRVLAMVRVVVVLRAYGAVRRQEDLANVAVSQTAHQVVVDIGHAVQLLGDAMNAIQRIIGEDGAFLHFHGHDDDVGSAESVPDAVVQLNVGVFLGQQVGEIRQHAHRGDVPGEIRGDQKNAP